MQMANHTEDTVIAEAEPRCEDSCTTLFPTVIDGSDRDTAPTIRTHGEELETYAIKCMMNHSSPKGPHSLSESYKDYSSSSRFGFGEHSPDGLMENHRAMVIHVAVYALGSRLGREGLMSEARKRFMRPSQWISVDAQVFSVIREVYKCTPTSDKGLREQTVKWLVDYLCKDACNARKLQETDFLRGLNDIPEYCQDFLPALKSQWKGDDGMMLGLKMLAVGLGFFNISQKIQALVRE